MDFNEYQEQANLTAIYPEKGGNIYYPTLGLAGEAGEVCEKVKKVMRDSDGILSETVVEDLKKELGDVLWYLSAIASELETSLGEIAAINIEKLLSRQARGKLGGSGDDR